MKTLVVALGGNGLLQRGEALTVENQYRNIDSAVPALARMAQTYRLAIVHGIATASGGFEACESKPGNGTVFRVFFPAIEEDVTRESQPAEAAPTGKERILLVDDDDILAEMGQTMLERLGYEVTVLTSSLEALALFQNHPEVSDVVTTDQTMPGMTGMDLARRMLQIRPDIPIILCTGFSNLVSEEQAKGSGIKGFAMKPMTKKEMALLLRTVLES